jgi:hypothetical protein
LTNQEALDFLQVLFEGCEGNVEFRLLPSGKQIFVPVAELTIPTFPSNQNVHFGVATRDGEGGKKENIVQIPALWMDIDFKETSKEEIKAKFDGFLLKPSIGISSGGGYHIYWVLKEPLGRDAIPEVERTLKRLAAFFGADRGATDASRILRLPGTLNLKYDPPNEVQILKMDLSLRYSLADFDCLPELPQRAPLYSASPNWREDVLGGVAEGVRNQTATRLAGFYFGKGLGEGEVMPLLSAWNLRNDPPLPARELENVVLSVSKTHLRNYGSEVGHGFKLIHAKDLLEEPEEKVQWIWDGILPQGGMSILVAKPKVGKSTLALNLAIAISRGDTFLGRSTEAAPVVYLALEEKRGEIRKRLEALGVKDEPLHIHFGLAPKGAVEKIGALIDETGAGMLIVDTMQKLARMRDLNDYAQVTNTLEPLMAAAREKNCHLLLTHHAGKGERRDGEEVLGSTAIFGGVDTKINMKRIDQRRTISTDQRYGENLPEQVIILGQDYSLSLGEPLENAKKEDMCGRISDFLQHCQEATEPEIFGGICGRGDEKSAALRLAHRQGKVGRRGAGKKGDPYRYFLPPVPSTYTRGGEKEEPISMKIPAIGKVKAPSGDSRCGDSAGGEKIQDLQIAA